MLIAHRPDQLDFRAACVLVPTMGALHAGHSALIERARVLADGSRRPVVVTVFVNPTQFNEPGDFAAYPRTLERDARLAADAGADAVFAPDAATVYPPDGSAESAASALPHERDLPEVARLPGLEDRVRPGHFAGVYAVVKRLFELTRPAEAVFGEKDWQQLQVVRALVRREGLEIGIVAHPTVRDPDGVAMSSRNARLTPVQRRQAGAMPAAIAAARSQPTIEYAERSARRTLELCGLDVEYAVVREAQTLMPPARSGAAGPGSGSSPLRLLLAARLGATRLIDNAEWPAGAESLSSG